MVDASALAALLFGEIKTRPHPKQASELATAFGSRDRLAIEDVVVDHDDTPALAASIGLTADDAGYLWLSRRLGAELVTLDQQLATAVTSQTP